VFTAVSVLPLGKVRPARDAQDAREREVLATAREREAGLAAAVSHGRTARDSPVTQRGDDH
jgi:hypothetical protein